MEKIEGKNDYKDAMKDLGKRCIYYHHNQDDKNAKDDKSWEIRYHYYQNHPHDLDAKDDDNYFIRELYYRNNLPTLR